MKTKRSLLNLAHESDDNLMISLHYLSILVKFYNEISLFDLKNSTSLSTSLNFLNVILKVALSKLLILLVLK